MKRSVIVVSVVFLLIAGGPASFAEEVYHKYQVSVGIGSQAHSDSLRTNSANTALFRNPFGGITAIDDPRPDAGSKNDATVKDDYRIDVQVSYGLLKWKWGELTFDSSVGYFKGDLGNLEVAGEFNTDPPRLNCGEATRFHLIYIPVGKVTEIPVQIGGTMRFRPRASGGPVRGMNPFISAGIGYIFAEIDPAEEFLQFSENVGRSTGFAVKATGNGNATPSEPPHQFKPAEVRTPDTFEYHVRAGIDFPIRKNLMAFFSAGWTWANKEIDITVDGKRSFGKATPPGETDLKYPVGGMPVTVQTGGFCDYASGLPRPRQGEPCKFTVGPPDGIPDTGRYYVQGGTLRYDGSIINVGVRYLF